MRNDKENLKMVLQVFSMYILFPVLLWLMSWVLYTNAYV